jgi:carboxymethylenebutenolidase
MTTYDLTAETIGIEGHGGDEIPAYLARPVGARPFPGVVLFHHMPGWDEWSKEVVRRFARHGYNAICPHLHHRAAPGASADDASAAMRAAGGAPDDVVMGDGAGAIAYLRALPDSNGKVGAIGHCSGGRHTWLAACTLPIDAAVDCYGGGVVMPPENLTPAMPVAPIDLAADMHCPLLGLFGNNDRFPSPDQVDLMDKTLTDLGKEHEFHRYDGAGHGFFTTDRASYNVEAAVDGWERIWDFYGRHLTES